MIETPEIAWTQRMMTAIIRIAVPFSRLREVMGPGISELMTTVRTQGIGPTGPWLNHVTNLSRELFEFEISVPVSSPVTPDGRVEAGVWPSMRVARTVYQGPYEGLENAWAEFEAWIAANGLRGATDIWEVYLVGPESSLNSADWRTQLNRPLVE